MENNYVATSTITIQAPVKKVWEALTRPELIKQYLFGTEVVTDWKVGSSITYKGMWEGKPYEDKGTIIEIVPEKLLETTYWSSMTGDADVPENYKKVVYALVGNDTQTTLTISNDHNSSVADRDHSAQNWDMVLSGLKKLLETP